ncbi:MAG: PaaI family thioesterase [Solirubrobacteraceae bacterium]|nr:PaaI family thioesterase [Solirubrobacteraceae bacterium]
MTSSEPSTVDDAPASWGEPRSRTVTWHDPRATAARGAEMSGREYLEAIADGWLPPAPIAQVMGFDVTRIGDGEVEFTGHPDESVYNPIGMVHGGFVATLLDSVVGCAVHTQLPAGVGYTSIDLNVSYLRAVHADSGRLTARGHVVKPGRRVAFAAGEVRDGAGKVVATATSSLLIMGPG